MTATCALCQSIIVGPEPRLGESPAGVYKALSMLFAIHVSTEHEAEAKQIDTVMYQAGAAVAMTHAVLTDAAAEAELDQMRARLAGLFSAPEPEPSPVVMGAGYFSDRCATCRRKLHRCECPGAVLGA